MLTGSGWLWSRPSLPALLCATRSFSSQMLTGSGWLWAAAEDGGGGAAGSAGGGAGEARTRGGAAAAAGSDGDRSLKTYRRFVHSAHPRIAFGSGILSILCPPCACGSALLRQPDGGGFHQQRVELRLQRCHPRPHHLKPTQHHCHANLSQKFRCSRACRIKSQRFLRCVECGCGGGVRPRREA